MLLHRRLAALVLLASAASVMGGPTVAFAQFRLGLGDAHYDSYYVTAYRDHAGSGTLRDWNCGTKTYDGHQGTDYGIGSWPGMDAGRDVVAAAAGEVTQVHDGEFDRCTSGACGTANYVILRHDDGKVSYYWHLKKFSIVVRVGQRVECGQKLGQVGSSGNATGPHLHFEPKASASVPSDDPYAGSCGGPTSWWVDQGSYLGLPGIACAGPPGPPPHPQVSVKVSLATIEGQERDFVAEGASAGIFDLRVGQTLVAHVDVTNAPAATAPVRGGEVGIELDPALRVKRWQILDNYPGHSCGEQWCVNSADGRSDQPPREDPGASFRLFTDAISAGETKRVALTLEAVAETPANVHAQLRAWVMRVEGFYAKEAFDAAPSINTDALQTFNGGDLRSRAEIDVWPALEPEPPTTPDPDPEPTDPGPKPDPAPGTTPDPDPAPGGTSEPATPTGPATDPTGALPPEAPPAAGGASAGGPGESLAGGCSLATASGSHRSGAADGGALLLTWLAGIVLTLQRRRVRR